MPKNKSGQRDATAPDPSGPTARGRRRGRVVSPRKSAETLTRLEAAQQAVGVFLRATRESQNLTQEQVSSMTKGASWQLSRAAISAIERGQNFPGMEAMLALSNVLYVDPKELVERARLSTVVPLDIGSLTYEELERQANQYFWAGDFRKALAVYDALLEKIALESPDRSEESSRRIASLEVRRATALRRAGALLSAIATAERAIALSMKYPEIQARAYVALAGLQAHRGNMPLARDAAERAIQLASTVADPRVQGWAWNVKAKVHYMSEHFDEARKAYVKARDLAIEAGDLQHLTHNEGNIGMCWWEQGVIEEASAWLTRAVERARKQAQPALEASWMVELGRMALQQGQLEEAESYAEASLRIAKPREHFLTIFRAEWLLHLVQRRRAPGDPDRPRLEYLRKLYLHLDQYEGIEEVQEFKKTALRTLAAEDRKTKR